MRELRKLARDLLRTRGRVLSTVLAMAVSLAAFNAVLGAFGTLTREITRNYLDSAPASATLELDDVSPELLAAAERRPEVAAATRRKTLHARFRNTPRAAWQRALLFVSDEFEQQRVAKLFHERGAVRPPLGTVLIERSALGQLSGDLGTELELELPGAAARSVRVAGVVHEPALAPARTEQAIYAYLTPETARLLGDDGGFDELRVSFHRAAEQAAIELQADRLARWIAGAGLGRVHGIRVPPPGKHPHQTQMTAVLLVFVVFGVGLVAMSSLLAAALVSTLMARQLREIGIMKALGARSRRIALLYAVALLALSLSTLVLAWLPGRWAGHAYALAVARLLNFDLANPDPPYWADALGAVVGLFLPVLVALPAVWSRSRVTVLQALGQHRVETAGAAGAAIERWVRLQSRARASFSYALRSVVRGRRRLRSSFALLVISGATFLAALNVARAWDAIVQRLYETRHYDVELRLHRSTALDELASRLRELPDVRAVEAWRSVPVAEARPGRIPIQHTYPDDSHGALTLVAAPDGARMLDVELVQGRWIAAADREAVVINQLVPGFDRLKLGGAIALAIEGRSRPFRVVGKIRQVGVGATAYVSAATFRNLVPAGAQQGLLWVDGGTAEAGRLPPATLARLERELERRGADLQSAVPLAVFRNAMTAHFDLLVKALLALAALIGLVGALGLGSAMSVSVLERTREIGVLRAVGATGRQVERSFLLEGLLVGAASLLGAVVLGLALSAGLGCVIGQLSFRFALPLAPSAGAVGAWSVLVLLLSSLGAWLPARRAGRLSVRDALNTL